MKSKPAILFEKVRENIIPYIRTVWNGYGYYISLAVLLVTFASVAYMYRSGTLDTTSDEAQEYVAVSKPVIAHSVPTAEPSPEPIADSGLVKPVNGEIIGEYSPYDLIWNDTLEQWNAHAGVDIAAVEGAAISACMDGTVSSVYNDALWGNVLEIIHDDGSVSRYSPMLSLEYIESGTRVKAGDTIGSLGSPSHAESAMESHLHFELSMNSEPIEPVFME